MNPIRVVVVDTHAVVREGVRSLMTGDPRFQVVGEACDGIGALAVVAADAPDVVLIDIAQAGLNGAQVVRTLRSSYPNVRTIALTVFDDPAHWRGARDAGVAGYVLKTSTPAELLRAVETVARGGTHVDSSIVPALTASGKRRSTVNPAALSARETGVVQLVARGHSNKEIAALLDISIKTVETYRYRATDKLGITGRSQIVSYAVAQGWMAA